MVLPFCWPVKEKVLPDFNPGRVVSVIKPGLEIGPFLYYIDGMLHFSREVGTGIMIVVYLATKDLLVSASAIAADLKLSRPMAAKILKRLRSSGILLSNRGSSGGYRLARSASHITLADVVESIQGPVSLAICMDSNRSCRIAQRCPASRTITKLNRSVRHSFQTVSIHDLVVNHD